MPYSVVVSNDIYDVTQQKKNYIHVTVRLHTRYIIKCIYILEINTGYTGYTGYTFIKVTIGNLSNTCNLCNVCNL